MLSYQRKTELELRKKSVFNKCLFKTHQFMNKRGVHEKPTVMEMLIQRKDVRGSQGVKVKEPEPRCFQRATTIENQKNIFGIYSRQINMHRRVFCCCWDVMITSSNLKIATHTIYIGHISNCITNKSSVWVLTAFQEIWRTNIPEMDKRISACRNILKWERINCFS